MLFQETSPNITSCMLNFTGLPMYIPLHGEHHGWLRQEWACKPSHANHRRHPALEGFSTFPVFMVHTVRTRRSKVERTSITLTGMFLPDEVSRDDRAAMSG